MNVLSIMDVQFEEHFGFNDEEVKALLAYYGIEEAYEDVKAWYDGYRFGNIRAYCPWDVISYADKRRSDPTLYPESYWINTSGNDIVRHLLENASAGTREEVERLIAGESVLKEIRNELTCRDIYDSEDNVWSVLFTTGYLTQNGRPDPRRRNLVRLVIPNEEIRSIFMTQIQDWMQAAVRKDAGELETSCAEALRQIEEKDYAARLRGEGMDTVLAYGFACYKKRCRTELKRMDNP